MSKPTSIPRDVYTVGRLYREVRQLIEVQIGPVWVEGELSSVARPGSGHLYFDLKDNTGRSAAPGAGRGSYGGARGAASASTVRCAMFRGRNRRLAFEPRDGAQVVVYANPGLYADRSQFQLIVESMELAGEGALRRAFEAMRARLEAEGLFEPDRKQAIPAVPRRIGIVTSTGAAALQDFLSVTARRFPAADIVIYPTLVQGDGAAAQIAEMIATADARAEVDVLVIARGGGSLEDLWAFNEEVVARAIAACRLPTVSGVGHETDITIADLVADRRAATPSAAAELITPDASAWRQAAVNAAARLERAMARRLGDTHQRLDRASERLDRAMRDGLRGRGERLLRAERRLASVAPAARLARHRAALNERALTLRPAMERHIATERSRLGALARRLAVAGAEALGPRSDRRAALTRLDGRLQRVITRRMTEERQRLTALQRSLAAVSPDNTLARGYAIVRKHDGEVVRSADDVTNKELLEVTVAKGTFNAAVREK